MGVRAYFFAAIAVVLAVASSAQPYSVVTNEPGYWHPLGRYHAGLLETGDLLAFYRPSDNHIPSLYSDVEVVEVFDEEQLKPSHGSYWQALLVVRVKCKLNKFHVNEAMYFNKPRFADARADILWEEDTPSSAYSAESFSDIKPNTLAAAVAKVACSEPVGMNL